jgi:hypothetical protein
VVDQLAGEYASVGQPVVFIEQNADAPLGSRYNRWWAAHGSGGSVYLPLIMIDSGNQISNGYLGSGAHDTYKAMVDTALARPPLASIQAASWRVGKRISFSIQLTNLSSTTLSSSNAATIHAIVYEDHTPVDPNYDHITGRIVRAVVSNAISPALASGMTTTVYLQTGDLNTIVDWRQVHTIALADYRPGGSSGAYDTLQAVFAQWLKYTIALPVIMR